jgi:DNA-binding transcriptional regulator of glucitol operon
MAAEGKTSPPAEGRLVQVWHEYGLSITLVAMFLIAWALQTWSGWVQFVSEQEAQGTVAQAFGDDGYVWSWAQATFTFIVLTTFLVHRHSHESPDSDHETEASLRRIEAKLDALEKKGAKR